MLQIPPPNLPIPPQPTWTPWGPDTQIAPVFGGWLVKWNVSYQVREENPNGYTYNWHDQASITFIPDPTHAWVRQDELTALLSPETNDGSISA